MREISRAGRPCRICSSSERSAIESRLLTQSVSTISGQFGISTSSIHRHVAAHLQPELREALRGSQSVSTSDLMQRIAEIADAARDARRAAIGSSNTSASIRAGDGELRALLALLNQLGIDDIEILNTLREGEVLARAVGAVAGAYPDLGELIAVQLDKAGADTMASALRSSISRNDTRKVVRS
jgi:hypothetical protein